MLGLDSWLLSLPAPLSAPSLDLRLIAAPGDTSPATLRAAPQCGAPSCCSPARCCWHMVSWRLVRIPLGADPPAAPRAKGCAAAACAHLCPRHSRPPLSTCYSSGYNGPRRCRLGGPVAAGWPLPPPGTAATSRHPACPRPMPPPSLLQARTPSARPIRRARTR